MFRAKAQRAQSYRGAIETKQLFGAFLFAGLAPLREIFLKPSGMLSIPEALVFPPSMEEELAAQSEAAGAE